MYSHPPAAFDALPLDARALGVRLLSQAVGLSSSNSSHYMWLSRKGVQPKGCLIEVWRLESGWYWNTGNIGKIAKSSSHCCFTLERSS